MSEHVRLVAEQATPPRVAVPHACAGQTCAFCEWSNPTLEIALEDHPRKE